MNATHSLARLVHGFFQEYMAAQKGLSPNTILSYRDAVKPMASRNGWENATT